MAVRHGLARSVWMIVTATAVLAGIMPAGAAVAASGVSFDLTCKNAQGKQVWTLTVPGSVVPAGVTPTLTLTPKSKVPAQGKYGYVCTLGPSTLVLAGAASFSDGDGIPGTAPAGFVGGAWVPLPSFSERGAVSGSMVTHAGDYGPESVPVLQGQYGAPNLGTPPPPVTTSSGVLSVQVKHLTDQASGPDIVGLGDQVTVTIQTDEKAGWICDGSNGPIPGGLSMIEDSPSLGTNPTVKPDSVPNATVTTGTGGVTWQTVAATGSCSAGNGSPDGLLPPGTYQATWKVGVAEPASQLAWRGITASFLDQRGPSVASVPFAYLDCTCTFATSATAVTPGETVTVSGEHWKPGTVNIVLGDVLVATATAARKGSFGASFTVPSALFPQYNSFPTRVVGLTMWAVGPGGHNIVQDMTISAG